MNFYKSRLFRYRALQSELIGISLTVYNRMQEKEQREHIASQVDRFGSSAARGLKDILLSDSSAVVPVGFLDCIPEPDTYVGVTIETMIEMATGSITPKFSLPLSRLLSVTSTSLANHSISSFRDVTRYATLTLILTRLSGQRVVDWLLNTRIKTKDSGKVEPEVVFCVVHASSENGPAL